MKKLLIMCALALAVQSAFTQDIPRAVTAIQARYPDAYFIGSYNSRDGIQIFWKFRMPSYEPGHFVIVTVLPWITPAEFGAHYTVALDSLRHYKWQKAGNPLPSYNPVQYPPANLQEILRRFPQIYFLGCGPSKDNEEIRWIFYFPPNEDEPGVVVNVVPTITADRMLPAYWTALGAVDDYIDIGDVPPKKQPAQPL